MPYERQLESIWLRLQDPNAPTPRHAISTRFAFDDVCAAFMQAELGPEIGGGGTWKPWGREMSGRERNRDPVVGREVDDVKLYRAERNFWAYYYGEIDSFPGRDPALDTFQSTNSRHGEDDVPNYAVQSFNSQNRDIGQELRGTTGVDQGREARRKERVALAIENRAREAERFMREREEKRKARWTRKQEAGWVRSEGEELTREEGGSRGSGGREQTWQERENREEMESHGRKEGVHREPAAAGFARWLERSSVPAGERRGGMQRGQDSSLRESEHEQRAEDYAQTDNEHRQSADNNNNGEKRKNGGLGSRARRREARKTRKAGRSMSPGREGSGRGWRRDELDAKGQEYRERDYRTFGPDEYAQGEPSGWSARGDGREGDYAVKTRHRDQFLGVGGSDRGGGARGRDDRRSDYDQNAGFESISPREDREHRRPFGAERSENDDVRRPLTLRRDDGRRFFEEEASPGRTSQWVHDGRDQVQGGVREDAYQEQLPRYPGHGRSDGPLREGGRDRGFGVMKDSRELFREDRERRREG